MSAACALPRADPTAVIATRANARDCLVNDWLDRVVENAGDTCITRSTPVSGPESGCDGIRGGGYAANCRNITRITVTGRTGADRACQTDFRTRTDFFRRNLLQRCAIVTYATGAIHTTGRNSGEDCPKNRVAVDIQALTVYEAPLSSGLVRYGAVIGGVKSTQISMAIAGRRSSHWFQSSRQRQGLSHIDSG